MYVCICNGVTELSDEARARRGLPLPMLAHAA